MTLPYYAAEDVWRALPFDRAIRAIEEALAQEVDPELDGPRLFSDFPDEGEFLLMPAQGASLSGVKVLTVAPKNPARHLEKIQGVYVLFDSMTAAPLAVIDGVSLTAIRTPAVAITALKHLAKAAPEGSELGDRPTVLTFGAGIQALNHIRAAHSLFPNAVYEVVGRRPERVASLIETLGAEGIRVTDVASSVDASGTKAAVQRADVVLCCTSTETPLFDGALVKDSAIVIATGTHGLTRREVDDHLVMRAEIAVEARSSALRENGNLVNAPKPYAGQTPRDAATPTWWNLRDLVLGNVTRAPGKPAFYSGVGMSWEDLIMASVIHREGTHSE